MGLSVSPSGRPIKQSKKIAKMRERGRERERKSERVLSDVSVSFSHSVAVVRSEGVEHI